MKTLLLYNPHAGRNRSRRTAQVAAAAKVLKRVGFEVSITPTAAVGSAGRQAREAIESGYKAIFACGGDGTIHDVLQGVADTNAVFGILPFGSANALARELGLDSDPVRAASVYRADATLPVRIGVLRLKDKPDRHFLSMAGAGPDGALMYRMLTIDRHRLGRLSYYLHAAHLFLSGTFPTFQVSYLAEDGRRIVQNAVALMLLRLGSLGGLFAGVARGASFHGDGMQMVLVHPPAWFSLPLWFVSSWTRISRYNPLLTICRMDHIALSPLEGTSRLHVQADGEWLGTGACEIELLQQTVHMLVPASLSRSAEEAG